MPFTNDYKIPNSIPEYQRITMAEKTDWSAKYIWDKENLTEENTWMCFNKSVKLDKIPEKLIAYISADSKYWLYINGETVVFEGNVKRGPSENDGYFDSVDIAPYLKKGENEIELTLTVGNRNLLGPFHTDHEGFIGPDTFERFGTWKDGKSPRFFEKYAFLKSII